MELPSTLEWRNKCLKAFSNTSEGNNRHEPDPKKIWLMSFDKIIYRLTLLGDMQAFDLNRIEEHFKVDIGRRKNTKAYQVLEFLNSTLNKNLILREDDDEECSVKLHALNLWIRKEKIDRIMNSVLREELQKQRKTRAITMIYLR